MYYTRAEVIEETSSTDEQEWTVLLRWRSSEDESDSQPGSAGD